jgi:hypothetical protein
VTVHPFACPRCGTVSQSRYDAREGYCGRCRTWTGSAEALAAMSREEYARYLEQQRAAGIPGQAWSWEELLRLYEAAPGMYVCGRCGGEFAVPPGHCEPVLCGHHSPPELMTRAGAVPWSRPDADPLADLQEARRLIAEYRAGPLDFEEAISYATDQAAASVLGGASLAGRSVEVHGELSPEAADALGNEIRRGLVPLGLQDWVADAIEVWDGCKDEARREQNLAELAQRVADAEPQIRPNERGTDGNGALADGGTAARWNPDDPGDVIL